MSAGLVEPVAVQPVAVRPVPPSSRLGPAGGDPFGGTYRGRRVLVTGHDGFKGTWLSLWLERLGADIQGVSTGPPSTPSIAALTGLTSTIPTARIDINDADALARAVAWVEPEIVFHLAAQPLVLPSYEDPRQTFATNVLGTVNLLEAVRSVRSVRAVVAVTSDKCYDPAVAAGRPLRETDPLGGDDPYSASKGAAEIIVHSYRHSFLAGAGVGLASVRAGNVVGGGDWAAHRLVPDVVAAMAAGRPVELRYPDAIRPWQHVLEPLSGYLQVGQRLLGGCGETATAWNFGPEVSMAMTVRELVDALAAAWNGSGEPEDAAVGLTPPRRAETGVLRLDPAKARRHLGWFPLLSLAETAGLTASWYRAWHHGAGFDARALTLAQIAGYEALARTSAAQWAIGAP